MEFFYFDLYQHRSRTKKTGFYDTIHSFFQTSSFITMKKLTILAAVLLAASAANAQDLITTRFVNKPEGPENPVTDRLKNPTPAPLGPGTFGTSFSDYNQDACIVQAGSTNYSLIKQTDTRTGVRAAGSGSSAYISQSGSLNNAFQTQTLDATSNQVNGRNLLSATQAGTASQSDQTQTGGFSNTAEVNQGAGTSENRAIQTQTGGNTNSALINQTNADPMYGTSSGNRAEQVQTGSDESAQIDQQGKASYAKQTQSGFSDHAYIGQGAPGMHNTAIQTQSGSENVARIRQSVLPPTVGNDFNYALQKQTGFGDQADIDQHGSHNFAQQEQAGSFTGFNDPNNESSIKQSNNYNGAYTGQTGVLNTANIVQQ